jgi:hypothetical protein
VFDSNAQKEHPMFGHQSYRPFRSAQTASLAILGSALLCSAAMGAPSASVHHHAVASEAAQLQRETVDQRIRKLHTDLAITPAEEADWEKVADVMRRNESVMREMVEERKKVGLQDVTAVDDLVIYQKFNQAHVDGLTDLIASFKTLYQTMPSTQKIVADHVFRGFGRERPLHH